MDFTLEFDREEDLRETFDFLVEFPKELKCLAFGEMISFPTYSYSVMSEENQAAIKDPNTLAIATSSEQPSREVYDYYHRLYRLTRTQLPVELIKEIGESIEYRQNPALIDPYLNPEKIPRFTGLSA